MLKKTLTVVLLTLVGTTLFANGPDNKSFGFGITLGDPMGGTIKYWTNDKGALNLVVGSSQFGKPRIGLDYQWHFDAFNVDFLRLYAGPGIVIGIGNGTDQTDENRQFYDLKESEVGVAGRAIIGFSLIPGDIPFELFLEMGPLVGIAPKVGAGFDFGIGFRFYP